MTLGVSPRRESGFIYPEGHSAPSNEDLIIMMPVRNTVSEIIWVVSHELLYRPPPSLANCATTLSKPL